jgi:hypothetical protein
LPDYQLEVKLSLDRKLDKVLIARGTVIANATPIDPNNFLLPLRPQPVYNRLFLRHFTCVTSADFDGVTVDDDGSVRFGRNFDVVLKKDGEVRVKNLSAVYNVETVVKFLSSYGQASIL